MRNRFEKDRPDGQSHRNLIPGEVEYDENGNLIAIFNPIDHPSPEDGQPHGQHPNTDQFSKDFSTSKPGGINHQEAKTNGGDGKHYSDFPEDNAGSRPTSIDGNVQENPDHHWPGGISHEEKDDFSRHLDEMATNSSQDSLDDESEEQKKWGTFALNTLAWLADVRITIDDVSELVKDRDIFSLANLLSSHFQKTEQVESAEKFFEIGSLPEDIENAFQAFNGKPLYMTALLKERVKPVWSWIEKNPWKGIAFIFGTTSMIKVGEVVTNKLLGDEVKKLVNKYIPIPALKIGGHETDDQSPSTQQSEKDSEEDSEEQRVRRRIESIERNPKLFSPALGLMTIIAIGIIAGSLLGPVRIETPGPTSQEIVEPYQLKVDQKVFQNIEADGGSLTVEEIEALHPGYNAVRIQSNPHKPGDQEVIESPFNEQEVKTGWQVILEPIPSPGELAATTQ